MNNEEKIFLILESIQKQIESLEKNTNNRFESIEKNISTEIQSTKEELDDLKESLNIVEQVTAKNWLDITRLKSIK